MVYALQSKFAGVSERSNSMLCKALSSKHKTTGSCPVEVHKQWIFKKTSLKNNKITFQFTQTTSKEKYLVVFL
jgi:GTP cyclohydrolase FolE2